MSPKWYQLKYDKKASIARASFERSYDARINVLYVDLSPLITPPEPVISGIPLYDARCPTTLKRMTSN